MRRTLMACAALVTLYAGCDRGPATAPVSGKVTLNGKPLANAWVSFQPVAEGNNKDPGRGSSGKTDAEGKYSLRVDEKTRGAIVGKHRVMIQPAEDGGSGGQDADSGGPRSKKFYLPSRYNMATTLTCDVPPGGREDANFDLKTP